MGVNFGPIDRKKRCMARDALGLRDDLHETSSTGRCYRTAVHRLNPGCRARAALGSVVLVLGLVLGACDGAPEASDAAPEAWPRTEACEGLDAWPEAHAELEAEALARIDARRAEGVDCGERGKWGPAEPLRRRTALDCAARAHALDMATEGYFGRLDADGRGEAERVEAAGYAAAVLVQHLAAGPRDAIELVDRTWGPRPVPCESMADPMLEEVGLGHVGEVDDEFESYWVLLLASPSSE
jgi:uncharacterized protein YkwD